MTLTRTRRLPKPEARFKQYRQAMLAELRPVAKSARKSREKVVANWSDASKPEFASKITAGTKNITIETSVKDGKQLPGNDATTGDLWKWIDRTGTRPHIIKPKKPQGKLRFVSGGRGSYQSKTAARPARFGGPGVVRGGEVVYRKQVNHPGFPPREFSKTIDDDLLRDFRQAVERGQRKGAKALSQR